MKNIGLALLMSCFVGVLAQGCGNPKNTSGFENGPAVDNGGGGGGGGAGGGGGGSADAGANPALGAGGGVGPMMDGGCATTTASTSRTPVYMLIVLDGSGSMKEDNKWKAVVPALDSIFDDFLAKKDKGFALGLLTFSDKQDGSCVNDDCHGPYPTTGDVPIAIVDQAQHDKLRARIDTTVPTYGTPTFAALSGGYKELEAFVPSGALPPDGKKVLVIMTDGLPSGGTMEQNQCTAAAAAELTKAAPQGPIRTFAVGIGQFPAGTSYGYDAAFMGGLAKAGGTAPMGCDAFEKNDETKLCNFQVTPNGKPTAQITKEFIDAINAIRGAVASCEFVLEKPDGGQIDPSMTNVVYVDSDGKEHVLVQDPVNGWTYDDPNDPTRIVIHGVDCDTVRADATGSISIVLGCATITK